MLARILVLRRSKTQIILTTQKTQTMVSHPSSTGVSYKYEHLKDIGRDANGKDGLENPHIRGKASGNCLQQSRRMQKPYWGQISKMAPANGQLR